MTIRSRSKRARASTPQPSAAERAQARRAKVVWVSFLAAMTVVGGGLLALDGRPAPRLDGLTLAPLLASTGPDGVASIFRTRSTLDQKQWKAIVIHHSGSQVGSPASIGAAHEKAGFKGLGHHFIIGNGDGMEDGELHVGFRWLDQLPGAHAAGDNRDYYNRHAISICLVGDGNRRPFSPNQVRRLAELVSALCRGLGIPKDHVYLASDVGQPNDPGVLFPSASLAEHLATAP